MGEEEKKKLYWYTAVAALLGVGGSTTIQMKLPDARSDPFTGSQGRMLERRVDTLEAEYKVSNVKLDYIIGKLEVIENHVSTLEKESEEWRRRILKNEMRNQR